MKTLTAVRLREVLHYDPLTGLFTRRAASSNVHVGDIAGSPWHGYINIRVDAQMYRAHRLAWLYMTGSWPSGSLDHANRNRADNKWQNLRLATRSQNGVNRPAQADNTSGYKGVCWHPIPRAKRQWVAAIGVDGKSLHLGSFATPERAFIAYAFAAWKHHGDFALIDSDCLAAKRRWMAHKAPEHSILRNLLASTTPPF